MSIKLVSQQTKITSVKYHREGSGDDPNNVAMDIKIAGVFFGEEILTPILGGRPAKNFWNGNDKELSFPHISSIEINTKIEGCKADINGIDLDSCNLGVFKFRPLVGGAMNLSFNIAAKNMTAAQQNKIKGLLGTEIAVLVEGGDLVTTAIKAAESDEEQIDFDD